MDTLPWSFRFCLCKLKSQFNFQLFPRDELKVGMPSYNFSCQSSCLASMALEGFDFNACINDGISYMSRAQESAVKIRIGNLLSTNKVEKTRPINSVADSLFTERIKARVKNWRNVCKDSNRSDDALISSLRKLIAGSEAYGSRPCLSIDVCSERQAQLVLEMLKEFTDVVPLQVPAKGKGMQVVRAVLASSEEDKNIFEKELCDMEEENNKALRGFREVIELISTSQKPVVAHNSLNDFASIYSKFLAPLPLTLNEFRSSLHLVFPCILDIGHLMKKCSPLEKLNHVTATVSSLKKRLSAPVDLEIPDQDADEADIHGNNVLKLCQSFVTLQAILKLNPRVCESANSLQSHMNIFWSVSDTRRDAAEDLRILVGDNRLVSTENLVFLWGLQGGVPAGKLKRLLKDSNAVFSEEFDVRMVDRTCALIVFWTPGFSEKFLLIMCSGEISFCKPKDTILDGLRAAGYSTYKRAFEAVLWEADLAKFLDRALTETGRCLAPSKTQQDQQSVTCWNNDDMINLDDL